jgi:putative transposase
MSRRPRVVAPGLPHRVTQRCNRCQRPFCTDEDYAEYLGLLADSCRRCGTQVLALRDALGEAHRRDTRMINSREGWKGHLWQERFHCFVMDERHLLAAVR